MERHLVVGLGNPEPSYLKNRHNVGFMVVDQLADEARIDVRREKFKGLFGSGTIGGVPVVLLKPRTFMNLSGRSVGPARAFFDISIDRVIVIHDEIDIPFGELRLKIGGGHAGHNGLRSLVTELGDNGFIRLRVGVGRPERGAVADHVLSDFALAERDWLPDLLERAATAVQATLTDGPRRAMNTINTKSQPEESQNRV